MTVQQSKVIGEMIRLATEMKSQSGAWFNRPSFTATRPSAEIRE